MKNVLLLLSVVFSSLFSTVSLAQTAKRISKDEALAIVQKQFVGMDITSKAGNLADALGNNIYYNVDSLVVRGTVDAADIRTL